MAPAAPATGQAFPTTPADFVAKPKIGVADGLRQPGADITENVRSATRARVHRLAAAPAAAAPGTPPAKPVTMASLGRVPTEKRIYIGASTGGTEATHKVVVNLPAGARS